MKHLFAGLLMTAAALSATGVNAKGCIKGALVGGVAGHMAAMGRWAPLRDAPSGTTRLTKRIRLHLIPGRSDRTGSR